MSKMPKTVNRAELMEYFQQHAGQVVWVSDLAKLYEGCGLKKEYLYDRIRASVRNLREMDDAPITTTNKGYAWRLEEQPQPQPQPQTQPQPQPQPQTQPQPQPHRTVRGELYEEVGRSKAGRAIVKDLNGNLYRLEEL